MAVYPVTQPHNQLAQGILTEVRAVEEKEEAKRPNHLKCYSGIDYAGAAPTIQSLVNWSVFFCTSGKTSLYIGHAFFP